MRISAFALIFLLGCSSCAFCEAILTAGEAEGSLYSYSADDPPGVFFFPKEKARWDGNNITMREWYMLTDLQKEKFITEYLGEMQEECRGIMEILGLDYLKALNLFSYYANEKAQREPSTKVIDLLIEGQNHPGTNLKSGGER
jgi:hypothetical protein